MPITAYSQHFEKELDVEQLLALMSAGSTPPPAYTLEQLPDQWREWIRQDVRCSSCGVPGAQIVNGAMAKASGAAMRQPHFRFVAQDGGDAHHRFCEFHHGDEHAPHSDSLVNFSSTRSRETRLVRTLVCKAIESRLLSQADIRAMRQWFFDTKSQNRYVVAATEQALEYRWRLRCHTHHFGLEFHPSHAAMPGFDWDEAALIEFSHVYQPLLERFKHVRPPTAANTRARALAKRHFGEEVFDASVLEPFYKQTLDLCTFFATHTPELGYSRHAAMMFRWEGVSTVLLAFCALLLHVSAWDIHVAIAKLGQLLASPPPADDTLGNVIGLNPFHDYLAWQLVKEASQLAVEQPDELDYEAQLRGLKAEMQSDYDAWKQCQ